jgi:hypothetical protein
MEIEMKKNYINGYNDAIKNFNGNSTLAEFIRSIILRYAVSSKPYPLKFTVNKYFPATGAVNLYVEV